MLRLYNKRVDDTNKLLMNNRLLQVVLAALVLILLLPKPAYGQDDVLPVVPYPQEVEPQAGRFALNPATTTIRLAASDTTGLRLPVSELQATFRLLFESAPGLDASARQTI